MLKKGDKIREIATSEEYTVAETAPGGIVRVEGTESWAWYPGSWFDLVSAEQKGGTVSSMKQWFLEYHRAATDEMHATTARKNADYTGTNDDPFSNFRAVEVHGICSTEQGFLVRMNDKMARITSFVQKGVLEVRDESVNDTLLDLANYCILMSAYIKAEKEKKNEHEKTD